MLAKAAVSELERSPISQLQAQPYCIWSVRAVAWDSAGLTGPPDDLMTL